MNEPETMKELNSMLEPSIFEMEESDSGDILIGIRIPQFVDADPTIFENHVKGALRKLAIHIVERYGEIILAQARRIQ
jgi:hypothetical protein